ncbi:hypothetical protein EDB83DRAFT_2317568 [Lactarius deliciosus]|nr:hypothetical protein EDB83DRAFT_2317568 [Lactarius deliciosus]
MCSGPGTRSGTPTSEHVRVHKRTQPAEPPAHLHLGPQKDDGKQRIKIMRQNGTQGWELIVSCQRFPISTLSPLHHRRQSGHSYVHPVPPPPSPQNYAQAGTAMALPPQPLVSVTNFDEGEDGAQLATPSPYLNQVIIASFWCSTYVPTLIADAFTSVTPGAALDSPTANTTRLLFAPPTANASDKGTDHIPVAHSREAECGDPAVLLFYWLALASPLAAHAARGASTIDDLAVAEDVNEDAGVASGRREGVVKRRRFRRDTHRRFEEASGRGGRAGT